MRQFERLVNLRAAIPHTPCGDTAAGNAAVVRRCAAVRTAAEPALRLSVAWRDIPLCRALALFCLCRRVVRITARRQGIAGWMIKAASRCVRSCSPRRAESGS